jgi:DNA helicase-2/ATP-dependent DNA helicase PcrA
MVISLDLDSLNAEQREAVLWPGGPLQIFAGAGSGKTRVITFRIAKLIQDGCHPGRIMAVTFTNKAAKEMRERIEDLVGGQAKSMWLGTFHSTCAKILRMEGEAIGLTRDFVIYDDSDQLGIIKDILKRMAIDEKSLQPRAILSEISHAKEKMLTPQKYAESASSYVEKMVAEIYPAYQKALTRGNALDFDDILVRTVELLEKSEEVRERLQERFMHILIDEYQDVNFVQYRFAQLLAGKHQNITIVGDDDQSIYAWRGADVSLMLRFSADYKDSKVITLAQNYRSTQVILRAAYDVIKHNRGRAEKQLWTENQEGAGVTVTEAGTDNEEAMVVADTIIKEVRAGRRKFGDFGILYRTNAQSRIVEESLLMMRIPHILVGGQRFYERKEIKDMIAYLRVILNPYDEVSMKRVINEPTRGIGPGSLGLVDQWARERSLGWWDAMKEQSVQSQMMKKALTGINQFMGVIEDAREVLGQTTVTHLLRHCMEKSGYVDMLKFERTEENISRLENLQEFLNVTEQYDATAEEPSLAGFLETITLISDLDNLQESGDAVTLMTLHSSKGLEFPVVFLMGLEEGVFPHSRSAGNETELEEERRLCYVGFTRAREELHLLHSVRRSMYGNSQFNRRSRFLEDIKADELDSLLPKRASNTSGLHEVTQNRSGSYSVRETQMPAESPPKPKWNAPFNIGQRVRHSKFGEGVVISCSPIKSTDAEITVAFPGVVGVKKLVQSLAKLEAI